MKTVYFLLLFGLLSIASSAQEIIDTNTVSESEYTTFSISENEVERYSSESMQDTLLPIKETLARDFDAAWKETSFFKMIESVSKDSFLDTIGEKQKKLTTHDSN